MDSLAQQLSFRECDDAKCTKYPQIASNGLALPRVTLSIQDTDVTSSYG